MKNTYYDKPKMCDIFSSADTWASGNSSNIIALSRSAQGAAADILTIPFSPLVPEIRDFKLVGVCPLKVGVKLNVGVAALSQAPVMHFYNVSEIAGSSPVATEILGTLSGYNAATGIQDLIYDLNYQGEALFGISSDFHAELTLNPAATTTIALYKAHLKYTLVEDAQD